MPQSNICGIASQPHGIKRKKNKYTSPANARRKTRTMNTKTREDAIKQESEQPTNKRKDQCVQYRVLCSTTQYRAVGGEGVRPFVYFVSSFAFLPASLVSFALPVFPQSPMLSSISSLRRPSNCTVECCFDFGFLGVRFYPGFPTSMGQACPDIFSLARLCPPPPVQ